MKKDVNLIKNLTFINTSRELNIIQCEITGIFTDYNYSVPRGKLFPSISLAFLTFRCNNQPFGCYPYFGNN